MVASFVQLASNESNLLEMFVGLDDETIRYLGGDGLPAGWRRLLSPVALQGNPAVRQAVEGALVDAMRGIRQQAESLLDSSGWGELIPAFEAGILRLSSSGLTGESSEAMVAQYVDMLKDLLLDPSRRLPVDDGAGHFIRALIDEGYVEPPTHLGLRHAGEASVGAGLVARLPAFRQAPLDELLDLRRDLSSPLTRYRSAVSRLASHLTSHPFDRESSAEVDDLWVTEAAPTLVEIETGLAEQGLVRELGRTLGADLSTLLTAGSAMYIGLGTLASLNDWISSTVAVAGPAAQAAAKAATTRRSARFGIQSHDLFYLYELNRRLQ